jgi:hypothetical protein
LGIGVAEWDDNAGGDAGETVADELVEEVSKDSEREPFGVEVIRKFVRAFPM